jgi:aromatic ring-cleaving dioxygenase
MRESTDIKGYHAHVYFDAATRAAAETIREALAQRFTIELGRVHDHPVGPHSQAMYQVTFAPEEFPKIVPWLMLNRRGLSILVHPRTGDDVADHDTNPLWLGEQLPVDLEVLRRHADSAAVP